MLINAVVTENTNTLHNLISLSLSLSLSVSVCSKCHHSRSVEEAGGTRKKSKGTGEKRERAGCPCTWVWSV